MRVSKFDRRICRFLLDGTQLRSTSGLALNLANASAAEGNPARLCEPYGTRDQRRALSPAPSATYSVAFSWDEL